MTQIQIPEGHYTNIQDDGLTRGFVLRTVFRAYIEECVRRDGLIRDDITGSLEAARIAARIFDEFTQNESRNK